MALKLKAAFVFNFIHAEREMGGGGGRWLLRQNYQFQVPVDLIIFTCLQLLTSLCRVLISPVSSQITGRLGINHQVQLL